MSKVEYKVIKKKRLLELELEVEAALNDGWTLAGGLVVIDQGDAKSFAQAVTQTKEEEAPAKVAKGKGEK